ncbi:TPA: GH32 C-terminal domain-containing protein, partial [Enterococcus faecium]
RVMIAWMQMWDRTLPTHELGHLWAGSMSLPRELRVKKNRLVQKPISTVYSHLVYQQGSENIAVTDTSVVFRNALSDSSYLHLVADLEKAEVFTIELLRSKTDCLKLAYDTATQVFELDRQKLGRELTGAEEDPLNVRKVEVPLIDNQLVLEIFRDTSSIEVFINGLEVMTATFYELEKARDILFHSIGESRIQAFETASVK